MNCARTRDGEYLALGLEPDGPPVNRTFELYPMKTPGRTTVRFYQMLDQGYPT